MANRALQAKALKLKRMKRLFPRHMSADYIPTGKPPDRFVIQEYKERARSLAFDDTYLAYLESKAKFHGIPPGKVEAMKRIKELTPSMQCFIICDMPALKAKVFFNAERTRWMIEETNTLIHQVRVSMWYSDKGRCIERWNDDTIRWVECSSLDPSIKSD